jgi:HPt (histidine-containing phosphotransfer) domain-containing protein
MTNITFEIDKAFLLSYYKEMVNEVGEIFQLFIEETPSDISQINESFASGKHKQVAEILHKIAPCFYNVGLPQLTPKVKAIESYIASGAIEDAKKDMVTFETELQNYMPAVIREHQRLMAFENIS